MDKDSDKGNIKKFKLFVWGIAFIFFMVIALNGRLENNNTDKFNSLVDKYSESKNEVETNEITYQMQETINEANSNENKADMAFTMGHVFLVEEDNEKAKKWFKESLKYSRPNTILSYLAKGQVNFIDGEYEESLDNYNKAYDIDNDDYYANFHLGYFYSYYNDTSANLAIPYFEKAYLIEPDSDIALIELSLAYIGAGEFENALESILELRNRGIDEDGVLEMLYYVIEDFDSLKEELEDGYQDGEYTEEEYDELLNLIQV